MSQNPIYPGFIWRQAFDFPQGFFQSGDSVRAEFRRRPTDELALAEIGPANSGTVIDGNRLFITLNKTQSTLVAANTDRVVTNFVVVRNEEEIPIGQIVSIPVVVLPTRPE